MRHPLNPDTPDHSELLRWWHRHQVRSLNELSDGIRNGLLQDLFTVRRQVELACLKPAGAAAYCCGQHLTELEKIYTQLEQLSSYLYSPFLEDSLPTALADALQPWHSKLPLNCQFASEWESDLIEHNRLLIGFTQRLLTQLTQAALSPHRCDLTLRQQDYTKHLHYHITYSESLAPELLQVLSNQLEPFLKTFQIFTRGTYEQRLHSHELDWRLCWADSAPTPENSHRELGGT
ncbi:hypothetical protein [Leptolyngbya iicbica]|uniref:Uncharacterized protein n=2 Tax=Cyanophyceae TaxID=3028117 RepID=A0A4Q7E412_9CYAN|nr:hypothetical protein [Leptolyngbya sp. LK]RZM76568.1 hypothetical protein DYY88_18055 [Leptolyngbya sp. LK]